MNFQYSESPPYAAIINLQIPAKNLPFRWIRAEVNVSKCFTPRLVPSRSRCQYSGGEDNIGPMLEVIIYILYFYTFGTVSVLHSIVSCQPKGLH